MNIQPLIQQNNNNPEQNDVDLYIIRLCSIISFFIPFVGFIYLTCFKISNIHNHSDKKKKAILILLLTSILGFIWQSAIFILLKTHIITLNF